MTNHQFSPFFPPFFFSSEICQKNSSRKLFRKIFFFVTKRFRFHLKKNEFLEFWNFQAISKIGEESSSVHPENRHVKVSKTTSKGLPLPFGNNKKQVGIVRKKT